MASRAEKEQAKRFAELLKKPLNKECFDCEEKGPRWASTNLGVFLCPDCAGKHREMGVHISKVKSVNLDKWDPDLISYIEHLGNDVALSLYRCNVPPGWRKVRQGADSRTRERSINDTYQYRKFACKDLDAKLQRVKDAVARGEKPGTVDLGAVDGSSNPAPAVASSAPAAPAPASTAPTAPAEWSCHRCTFLNTARDRTCKMCETPRQATPAQPAPAPAPTSAPVPAPVAAAPVIARPPPQAATHAVRAQPAAPVAAPAVQPEAPKPAATSSANLLDLDSLTDKKDDGGFTAFMTSTGSNVGKSNAASSILDAFGGMDVGGGGNANANRNGHGGPPPLGNGGAQGGPPPLGGGMGNMRPGGGYAGNGGGFHPNGNMGNMGGGNGMGGMGGPPPLGGGFPQQQPQRGGGMGGPPPLGGMNNNMGGGMGMGMGMGGMGMGMGMGMGGAMNNNMNRAPNAMGGGGNGFQGGPPPLGGGMSNNNNMGGGMGMGMGMGGMGGPPPLNGGARPVGNSGLDALFR